MAKKVPIRRARPKSYTNFGEIGRSGLNHWGGEIREEFLREFRGKEGRKLIREMRDNDPIIGALLFAVQMMIRQAKPHVRPAIEPKTTTTTVKKGKRVFRLIKEDPTSKQAKEVAEFVQSCFNDMSETWEDTVSEILTMLEYGWAWLEVVYKKRQGPSRDPKTNSRFSDGRIGWRKMPLRSQDSLKRWVLDETGGVQGMIQKTTDNREITIPIEKSLLFRTTHNKNNPEGRSVLRNIYKPYHFKKRIEEIEGIGIERDLAGLPVLIAPEGIDLWDEADPVATAVRREAEIIVQSIRRDEQEGVLLPFGWNLSLLASAGKRNFDTTTVIGRYNNSIAMTMLGDFIVLGHNNRYGSFALSSSKTHMFAVALGGWLQAIAAVFNRYAIPRLLEVNGIETENIPVLEFEDIELPDLNELGTYIYRLHQAGFQMFPNVPLEKKLLAAASMPTEDMELGRDPMERLRAEADIAAEVNARTFSAQEGGPGGGSADVRNGGKRAQQRTPGRPISTTRATDGQDSRRRKRRIGVAA